MAIKKVNIKNKDFIVVPEGRIVKGEMAERKVRDDLKMGIKPLYRRLLKLVAEDEELDNGYDFDNIKAVAYCDEDDEFDEKAGIDVCGAKLDLKNHRKLERLYRKICDTLMEVELIALHMMEVHKHKAEAIEEDLRKTYGRK